MNETLSNYNKINWKPHELVEKKKQIKYILSAE